MLERVVTADEMAEETEETAAEATVDEGIFGALMGQHEQSPGNAARKRKFPGEFFNLKFFLKINFRLISFGTWDSSVSPFGCRELL